MSRRKSPAARKPKCLSRKPRFPAASPLSLKQRIEAPLGSEAVEEAGRPAPRLAGIEAAAGGNADPANGGGDTAHLRHVAVTVKHQIATRCERAARPVRQAPAQRLHGKI